MRCGLILCASLFMATVALSAPRQAPAPESAADPDTVKLEQEVDALVALHDLGLTPDHLSAVKGMISDTVGTMQDPPTPITDDYHAALTELRRALLSKDKDRIEHAQDKSDELQDKQDPDSDAAVDQSDSSKEKAAPFLKMLSARQVANFISKNSDDLDRERAGRPAFQSAGRSGAGGVEQRGAKVIIEAK